MSQSNDFAELREKKPLRHFILWATLLFFIIALIWANFAELEEVTRAPGEVIPSKHVQLIQNLEGGIIKQILVREGETVKKGQVLLIMDDTRFSAQLQELQAQIAALQIKKARLSAEVNNQPLKLPEHLQTALPDLAQTEIAQFKSRQNEKKIMESNYKLTLKELNMTRPLLKKGAVSQVEVLRLEQKLAELRRSIINFESTALDELNKTKSELANLHKKLLGIRDQVDRTTVRSPVAGIVKQIYVTTIGGVVKPGMNLIEVVPLDDTLLVEGHVRPSDIGFLKIGQPALVKITAYDFLIYGGLKAKVVHISADTTKDKENKSKSYYEVWVRTDKNYLMGKDNKKLNIIPGMQASINVITGKKSVLTYLLKPVLKAKQVALTER
jgi:membrane fusion protein, adhesin transport system